jgi:hypothetical protein
MNRMRERARLGFDGASFHALVWMAWGSASPKSLRLVLRTILRLRNAAAAPWLAGKLYVEWTPLPSREKAP